MSADPTDYPPAVLEEAEAASGEAFEAAMRDSSGAPLDIRRHRASAKASEAAANVFARYTVSQRLARSPGGVLVLDTPGEPIPAVLLNDEPPPVDEDAAAEARAYERGRTEERANAVALLRQAAAKLRRGALNIKLSREQRDRCAMKANELLTFAVYIERGDRAEGHEQGAASS